MAAVCAIIAAAGYGASLVHLTGASPTYGVTWDVTVSRLGMAETADQLARRLAEHPQVGTAAMLLSGRAFIDGQDVPLMAIEDRKGRLPLAVVEGRAPQGPEEIALGSITLRRLGKQVGDTVQVASESWPVLRAHRVVGRAVLNQGGIDNLITPATVASSTPAGFAA